VLDSTIFDIMYFTR